MYNVIGYLQIFFLVFTRLYAMFAVAPFYSSILLPQKFRIILTILTSIIMYPMVLQYKLGTIPLDLLSYVIMLMSEAFIGLSIGFLITMIISIFQLSAQFFSIQVGFGISEVFDPMSQEQVPTIGQFLALMGLLVFFSIDGHLLMISSLLDSFKIIPEVSKANLPVFKDLWLTTFMTMFKIALQISLPIVGTVFLVTISMAILGRFAPQMNILMIGFPIYIIVGLLTLILITPLMISVGRDVIYQYIIMITRGF